MAFTRMTLVIEKDALPVLEGLKWATVRTIQRKAMRQGAKVIVRALKASVPTKTRSLQVSIGSKVTVKKTRITLTVGPKSRFQRGKKIPNKYAKKQDIRHHFRSKAFAASRTQATDTIIREIEQGQEFYLNKHGVK